MLNAQVAAAGCDYVDDVDNTSCPRLRSLHYRCNICFGVELIASPATNYIVSGRFRQRVFVGLVGPTQLWHSCRYDWIVSPLIIIAV